MKKLTKMKLPSGKEFKCHVVSFGFREGYKLIVRIIFPSDCIEPDYIKDNCGYVTPVVDVKVYDYIIDTKTRPNYWSDWVSEYMLGELGVTDKPLLEPNDIRMTTKTKTEINGLINNVKEFRKLAMTTIKWFDKNIHTIPHLNGYMFSHVEGTIEDPHGLLCFVSKQGHPFSKSIPTRIIYDNDFRQSLIQEKLDIENRLKERRKQEALERKNKKEAKELATFIKLQEKFNPDGEKK